MPRLVPLNASSCSAGGALPAQHGWRQLAPGLAVLCLAALFAGCNGAAEPMPRPAPTDTPPFAALETPGTQALAQGPGPSPLDQPPIVTPAPVATPTAIPTATPTSLPYRTEGGSDGMPVVVTPVAAAPLVTCQTDGDEIACYDDLLAMAFRYPAFMGPLRFTQLRQGGYSGYAYEYRFGKEGSAGGRSSDFGEGRGSVYTDWGGFGGRTAAELCAQWQAAICQEPGPGVLLLGLLPKPERLCGDVMPFAEVPDAILALDLPGHPLIQGFAFSFPLLGPEDAAEFRDDWYSDEIRCAPDNHAALAAYVEQLAEALPAGSGPAEMQARYDALIKLAESVQSPYFGGAE